MKKARYDVYKFGIKGLDKEEQENAKIQLAIKLGANKVRRLGRSIERNPTIEGQRVGLRLTPNPIYRAKSLIFFSNH